MSFRREVRETAQAEFVIAEDSPTQQEHLRAILEDNGFVVRAAANGRKALELIRERKPILLISDIVMPEMDGYALCRAIKEDEDLNDVPVILVTDLSGSQDIMRGLESGADNFITKPYDEVQLLARINYILANRAVRPGDKVQMGVEIAMGGRRHFITSERQQILDLLISSYEEAVVLSDRLRVQQRRLEASYQTTRTLYDLAQALNRCRTQDQVVQCVLTCALELPGVVAGWILLKGEDGRTTRFGDEAEAEAGHVAVTLSADGVVVAILNLVIEDDDPDERRAGLLESLSVQSGMALERARLNDRLEARVVERTAALQETLEVVGENEARLRNLAANVPGVLFMRLQAKDGSISYPFISSRAKDVLDVEASQIMADPSILARALDATFRERVQEAMRRSEATGEGGEFDGAMMTVTGRRRWARILFKVRRTEEGTVWDGLLLDMTHQREAEVALQQSQSARQHALDRYSSILNALPANIALLDHRGVIIDVNDRWRVFVTEDGFSGTRFSVGMEYGAACRAADGGDGEAAAAVAHGIRRVLAGTLDRFSLDYVCTASAAQRWFRMVASPVDIGAMRNVIVMHLDITEQKQLSERQNLLEQQLSQAQKMEAIGNLTGGMAHDFNNVLTIVMGNLEGLIEVAEGQNEVRGMAEAAIDACLRGAELTSQLLALARRQPLEPKLVDVNGLVTGISKLLTRTLGQHIEIVVRTAKQECPVIVDGAQLESAITNLAVNARDAMPRGGRLTIETDLISIDEAYAELNHGAEPGDYVRVIVTDTGSGIPAEILERIFEPFFTTKEVGKGTGLGLAMIFAFVKQSGGYIKVYSEVGIGTTFRLYLPCARDAGTSEARPRAIDDAPVARAGERILVVDDNADIRRLVAAQLHGMGYQTIEAADGPSALDVLQRGEPVDLLFTDVVMQGGMNGVELADRASALRPALPVLLTSGFAAAGLGKAGLLSAGRRLLTKPYRRLDLARAIRGALDALEP